jgi:hypothetical protein
VVGILVAALIVGSCAGTDGGVSAPKAVPQEPVMGFVTDPAQIANNTVRTAEGEFLEVCKDFVGAGATASSTADFDISGTLTSGGASTTANGSITLGNGECKEVFFSGYNEYWSMNVAEAGASAASASTTVKVTYYNGGATTSSTGGASAASGITIGPRIGALVEFTNTVEEASTGCTLTQGYWKNHTGNWAGVAFTPNTSFYSSGKSYIQVMNTPARGDAYYILAYQFIAALLNGGAGASTTAAVDAAITGATGYYSGNSTPSRAQLIAWASTLESYNSGGIGPGHCDD